MLRKRYYAFSVRIIVFAVRLDIRDRDLGPGHIIKVGIDIDLAKAVVAFDDKVDEVFDSIKEYLINQIRNNKVENEIELIMIAKYLERIGDHATNIAEWVEFSITGVHTSDEVKR